MKKLMQIILCTTLLASIGCTKIKTESADDHYSGCTFIVESGDYYNIGFEIHYANTDEIEWNYALEHQVYQLLEDLMIETDVPVSLKESQEYCGDIKRTNTQTQRYALPIQHELHDEMVQMLSEFSFTLTLNSKTEPVQYSSEITLPVIDVENIQNNWHE